MKTIRLTYCGVDGEGPTVAAAKQDAARKIEDMVTQLTSFAPTIIAIEGWAALVAYCGPNAGWGHRLITGDQPGTVRSGPQYLGSSGKRDVALMTAAKHVADCAWRHDIADDAAWLEANRPEGISAAMWRDASSDLLYRYGWQRRYKAARDDGYDDNDARHITSGLHHMVKSPA